MVFVLDNVKKQVIGLLNLSPRDTDGVPTYTASVTGGDTIYAQGEIDRSAEDAVIEIMRTICETAGHPHRALFTQPEPLIHGDVLPDHYGPIGVPKIRPWTGAPYTINGKVKSIEEISAYRTNPGNIYSATAHNAQVGATGRHSKLAGYYAIDEAAQVIYFTGFSAESDIAWFQTNDYLQLPDDYYSTATSLAIMRLRKDGDVSDIFSTHAQLAVNAINQIKSRGSDQPSVSKTVGSRDSGMK
jgi:hypothetical protein